jgi:YD repeat-containing protein
MHNPTTNGLRVYTAAFPCGQRFLILMWKDTRDKCHEIHANALQAPIRNASIIGVNVYSHSGEYSSTVQDFVLPGRGLSLGFSRTYRSARAADDESLGRGWYFDYDKRLLRQGKNVVYHDGAGRQHLFRGSIEDGIFESPVGFYSRLSKTRAGWHLAQRGGTIFEFEEPAAGGRLLAIHDRNNNALTFRYQEEGIEIKDSLGAKTQITFERGRITGVVDPAGRRWRYRYDSQGCLIEHTQPATASFSRGTSTRYAYDSQFRLISITDPNGQRFLRNSYDSYGRVVRQRHGNGLFEFRYEHRDAGGTRTRIRQKNGALLTLDHDRAGHVVSRTLIVETALLSPEDRRGSMRGRLPLATESKFNAHGEVIQRRYPWGNRTDWHYDEHNADPLARGNLLEVVTRPARTGTRAIPKITTKYRYEPRFQRVLTCTDPQGRRTSFRFDRRGNVTQKVLPSVTVQTLSSEEGRRKRKQQLVRDTPGTQVVSSLKRSMRAARLRSSPTIQQQDPAASIGSVRPSAIPMWLEDIWRALPNTHRWRAVVLGGEVSPSPWSMDTMTTAIYRPSGMAKAMLPATTTTRRTA